MPKIRIISGLIAVVFALALGFVLLGNYLVWTGTLIYLFHIILAMFFFAMLVSNQQYREDALARIERVASAALFSYALFIQLLYAPMARYFFADLIQQKFFLSDVLALMLFLFFIFIFFTSTFVMNSFSKNGFLSEWLVLNNPTAYFVLRNLFLSAVLLSAYFFWQMPFLIITV